MTLAKALQAAAGNAAEANYIEDVFSTYLYTGNGSTQTITNGIDLAGEGGLVFLKSRTNVAGFPSWFDTSRGVLKRLQSSSNLAEGTVANSLTSFNSDGFSVGSVLSASSENYVSWTFRKQPKFFDVVTWTGNGVVRTIPHNLGSVPGCIITKDITANSTNWNTYHRGLSALNQVILLNSTAAQTTASGVFNATAPTSTEFTVGISGANTVGRTYVAYLFAHDAGGFGLSGADNVVSCGSFTTDGSGNATVNLGYEPQWVMYKQINGAGSWPIFDTMRGFVTGLSNDSVIHANLNNAEITGANGGEPNATGFSIASFPAGNTYIYIAIRRGPMKVPKSGTSVFDVDLANPGNSIITTTFPVDLNLGANRAGSAANFNTVDRLRGGVALRTSATDAEQVVTVTLDSMNSFSNGIFGSGNHVFYSYKRAPGFMDVCCYTGTGSARTVAHNLAAVPELMIVKKRSATGDWHVWNPDVFAIDNAYITLLNSTVAVSNSGTSFNSTAPTSTVFSVGTNTNTNASGATYVSYLFATCPGVSKVGSYTGTGTTQQINCGFTGGARFVLIKRIASAGGAPAGADWYVWDSARGIVAGNDPYLLLNSTAAEVTSTDYVDTYSAGFEISSTAPAEINASGGTFIFLAIA